MVDVVDAATRSRMMSGIRSKNTKPERIIRSELHKLGFRFRLHSSATPGRPDLVLPKYQAAVHINGCYWHGHDCKLYRLPNTRRTFWKEKIQRNRLRDRRVLKATLAMGWRHLAIWECAFRGSDQLGLGMTIQRAARWLEGNRRIGTIRSKG
jgi:DNA mismatch endonuclease, patch repair protein